MRPPQRSSQELSRQAQSQPREASSGKFAKTAMPNEIKPTEDMQSLMDGLARADVAQEAMQSLMNDLESVGAEQTSQPEKALAVAKAMIQEIYRCYPEWLDAETALNSAKEKNSLALDCHIEASGYMADRGIDDDLEDLGMEGYDYFREIAAEEHLVFVWEHQEQIKALTDTTSLPDLLDSLHRCESISNNTRINVHGDTLESVTKDSGWYYSESATKPERGYAQLIDTMVSYDLVETIPELDQAVDKYRVALLSNIAARTREAESELRDAREAYDKIDPLQYMDYGLLIEFCHYNPSLQYDYDHPLSRIRKKAGLSLWQHGY